MWYLGLPTGNGLEATVRAESTAICAEEITPDSWSEKTPQSGWTSINIQIKCADDGNQIMN